ncbi:phage tail protein, partial [Klebsiella aerogenes]
MTDTNYLVSMPVTPFSTPRSFKSVSNGAVYIGEPDTDPSIPDNQIPVFVVNEDGSEVQIFQPIVINAGGFPVYNGQIMKFVTKQNFSMAVYDAYGTQQYYWPDISQVD